MVTVTKKHQASILIAVVLATVMIAGTFASTENNMALATGSKNSKHSASHFGFADKGKDKSAAVSQSIDQQCDELLSAPVQTSGSTSPITASGIPVGVCLNFNDGGNGVQLDQSDNQE